MKHALTTTLFLAASLAHAATGDLIFGMNMDTVSTDGNSILYTNVSDESSGSLATIGKLTGNANFLDPSAHTPFSVMATTSANNASAYTISSAQTAAAGLSLTTGFTLGMNVYVSSTATNWRAITAVGIGDLEISLQNPANALTLQKIAKGSSSGHQTVYSEGSIAVADNTLVSTYISFKSDGTNTQITLSIFNTAGDLIGSRSGTLDGVVDAAIEFQGTDFARAKSATGVGYANVGIWEGVLPEDYMSHVALQTSTAAAKISSFQTIPEPSTATISLLALAGLMARRRRAC